MALMPSYHSEGSTFKHSEGVGVVDVGGVDVGVDGDAVVGVVVS